MSDKNTHQVSWYDSVLLCADHAQSVEKEHIGFCCRTLGVDVGSLTTEGQDMLRLLLMCDDVGLMPPWPDVSEVLTQKCEMCDQNVPFFTLTQVDSHYECKTCISHPRPWSRRVDYIGAT